MMASKPGFFDIGLNIGKKQFKKNLSADIEEMEYYLQVEPIYIRPAIRNIQAMLLFYSDSGETRACSKLEELITEHPGNLNALANLIHISEKIKRNSDYYESQFEFYKDNPISQARSILEQANALTYDYVDVFPVTAETLLKDTWKILYMEDQQSQHVIKTKNLIVEAYKTVKTTPKTPYEETIDAKRIAVEKFVKGIEMLENLNCSPEEILVWKHNLAIARGRLDSWRNDDGDLSFDRIDNWNKALEDHLDVIENLPQITEPLKRYVAKSCVYFAQLKESRQYFRSSLQEKIKKQDSDLLAQKAKSMCPNDPTVLTRYGRYLSNKREYLKAIDMYDEAISHIRDAQIYWFAYAGRSQTYLSYCKNLRNSNQISKYLELAYNDAKVNLKYKYSFISMKIMAKICFSRAVPDFNSGINFHCQKIDFVHEAVEILIEALKKLGQTKDFTIYFDLGKFYPYIGEYRKAVEFSKTALELKWNPKFPEAFINICKCLVALYVKEKDENLLAELRYMLNKAKKQHCYKWVTDAMENIKEYNSEMLIDLVQNMINWDVRNSETIIKEAFKVYDFPFPNLREEFHKKLRERNEQRISMNGPMDINGLMEIRKSASTGESQYDFFVSYSPKEKEWVNCVLRPRIEDFDADLQFKGCLASRDFVPGERVADSIVKGINQSCKLLIVLSPEYIKNDWPKYCKDSMIRPVIERKIKEKNIILLMLESCDIPKELEDFTAIFFTEFSDWDFLLMDLSVNTEI